MSDAISDNEFVRDLEAEGFKLFPPFQIQNPDETTIHHAARQGWYWRKEKFIPGSGDLNIHEFRAVPPWNVGVEWEFQIWGEKSLMATANGLEAFKFFLDMDIE